MSANKLLLRIFKRLDVDDSGCWNWVGAKNTHGYGSITIRAGYLGCKTKRSYSTHKVIWELCNSPVPNGICVLHKCDNRSCGNPDHLFLGTPKDNILDCKEKGRNARGEKQHAAKLTKDKIINIREDNRTQCVIAEEYGVTQSAISLIKLKKNWAWV